MELSKEEMQLTRPVEIAASQLISSVGRQFEEARTTRADVGKEMESKSDGRRMMTQAVRWTARAWAVASIGLILAFLVGEGFHPSQIKAREWVGLLFFPVGICAGMILAWWKEGLGGSITVGSLLIFYMIHLVTAGAFPKGWAWWVFAAPGFLFLLSWQQSRVGGPNAV